VKTPDLKPHDRALLAAASPSCRVSVGAHCAYAPRPSYAGTARS
jgi:hypothetical protein